MQAADQVKSGVEPLLAAIQRDWNPSLLQSALVPGMPPEDYKRVIKWLMDNEKKLLAGFMEDRKLIAAMSQVFGGARPSLLA